MRRRSKQAFTLVEVMIVVAIVGLLAAIAVPNFMRVREAAQANACINNLRLIDAAKQQWALEFRRLGSDEPGFEDIEEYLVRAGSGRLPLCPASAGSQAFTDSYIINQVTNVPTCVILGDDTHVLEF